MNNLTGYDNVIGIVGGMGPEAGAELFNRILARTKARKDQEHLSVMLMSLPKYIVDRTLFLKGEEIINPALNIAKIILVLEAAGATVIGIPCNTSHVPGIYEVIREQLHYTNSKVKLLNMPLETCRSIKNQYPQIRKIGVMSTNGTYKSGLYTNLLRKFGYDIILPDAEFQNDIIHSIIYDPLHGIKANPNKITKKARVWIEQSLDFFRSRGAEGIILGCTEFSTAIKTGSVPGIFIIDSTESLAIALIREAEVYKPKNKFRNIKI